MNEALRSASPAELTDTIGQLHALITAAFKHLCDCIAAYDERELWRGDGAASMADWLSMSLAITASTAREHVRIARALAELPAIAAALGAGELSIDQAKPLTRFATAASDARLAAEAPSLAPHVLQRMAERRRCVTSAEAAAAHDRRELSAFLHPADQMWHLRGRLPAETGQQVVDCLRRAAQTLPPNPLTGLYDPHPQRMADALTALATQPLHEGPGRAVAVTQVVHVDAATLTGGSHRRRARRRRRRGQTPPSREDARGPAGARSTSHPRGPADARSPTDLRGASDAHSRHDPTPLEARCELQAGPAIAVETARRLLCDAQIDVALHDRGRILGLATAARAPTPRMLNALWDRDGGCVLCGRTWHLHAHHCTHREHDGPTSLDNLMLLCSTHHPWLHEAGWRGRIDNGVPTLLKPDGTTFDPRPPALRAGVGERLLL